MEEHAQKINNKDILLLEGHQVTELTKYDEVGQD